MDESLHDMDNAGCVVVDGDAVGDAGFGNVVGSGSDVRRFPDVGGYDKMEGALDC